MIVNFSVHLTSRVPEEASQNSHIVSFLGCYCGLGLNRPSLCLRRQNHAAQESESKLLLDFGYSDWGCGA